jgi:capsular exopolysaccharide synthesis family protein
MEHGAKVTAIERRRGEWSSALETPWQLPPPEPAPTDPGISLASFFAIIRRQRIKLLAFVALSLLAAVVIQFTVPKLYEATALVKVDRRQAAAIEGAVGDLSGPGEDLDPVITTDIELAQSDTVLRPVVEKYHLLDDKKGMAGLSAEQKKRLLNAPIELKGLKVTRPPNTYLLRIVYRAHNPQLAADVANAVALSLTQHANDTTKHFVDEASSLVSQDEANLRAKLDKDNQQLVAFQKELGIVDPGQRVTVLTARLEQLNADLTAAEADRVNREATLQQLARSHSLATAQAADSIHAIQDSGLNEALVRLDAARQHFAEIKSYYGETHPEYRKAKEQVDELTTQLNELVINAQQRASTSFQQALEREKQLRALVQSAKADVDQLQGKAQQYDQLKSDAESDRKLYQDMTSRSMLADVNKQFSSATVQIFSEARPPMVSIFPKLGLDLALAFVLSCIFGVLGAVLADALDSSLSDPEEVAKSLEISVLGVLPSVKHLPSITEVEMLPSSGTKLMRRNQRSSARYAEAVRGLRTGLILNMLRSGGKTVQITSAIAGEGKSTTTSRLCVALAQIGKRVLLIDADMRRPTAHKIFKVGATPGLSDVLEGNALCREAIIPTHTPGLFLMPAGPVSRRAAELVSLGFSTILAQVSRDFDLIFVDSPPMNGAAEAQEISTMVDGVIVVAKSTGTQGKLISTALTALSRARANVLGLVINQVRGEDSANYSYYYYSTNDDATAAGGGGA